MTNEDSHITITQTTIRHLAEATAKLLGWTLIPEEDNDYGCRDVAELEGSDEIRIFWFSPWRPKDRIEITGCYPVWRDESTTHVFNPGKRVSITIGKDSTSEHAVREIKRRFLPAYLAELAQAKRHRAEGQERNRKQARVVEMLEAAGARRNRHTKGRLDIELPTDDGHRYGDLKVCEYDGTVDVELRNLSAEQAVAVLRVLFP